MGKQSRVRNVKRNYFNCFSNYNAVRPVASIHCGYAINGCIRDNIETNYVL